MTRLIPYTGRPLRAIVVGAGPMGRGWLRNLQDSKDVEPVALVDLSLDAATSALAELGLGGLAVAQRISELPDGLDADVVVNVTVPAAHHAVSTEALRAGYPVLTEKPLAPTVSEALSLAAAAEASGHLLMVSQSRRYYRTLDQFKSVVDRLGEVGLIRADFFKAPRFGGFRDEMAHPLLIDMAIHAFDAMRYLVDDEVVAVYCDEFNPAWSWYRGDASVVATFTLRSGARFVYTGSWCADGLETSWNGDWRISAARGTARWDGESAPTWEGDAEISAVDPGEIPEEIAGSLAEFVAAVRTGAPTPNSARGNLASLAMVEAAVLSAERGERVILQDVVDEALQKAIADERDPEIAGVLRSWAGDRGTGIGHGSVSSPPR
ncbi:Gfo/Idh/MocA family oxidoreductase [Microbacterium sp. NPDC019599]|uniref:Gfo/Idh/MocA family protein n=1 Tax=Microbacterium sp. NPDC019599 TaxID=3154690 RepID=UPI0033FD3FFB